MADLKNIEKLISLAYKYEYGRSNIDETDIDVFIKGFDEKNAEQQLKKADIDLESLLSNNFDKNALIMVNYKKYYPIKLYGFNKFIKEFPSLNNINFYDALSGTSTVTIKDDEIMCLVDPNDYEKFKESFNSMLIELMKFIVNNNSDEKTMNYLARNDVGVGSYYNENKELTQMIFNAIELNKA
ncbi:hypothetical protein LOS1_00074 [Campylobacter phage vB_CjeM_Los1]|uniref:Uncharacterized protein n=1 Tax=Campylobacter phage vB_CjeM_Los1 TaxID=1904491 RepID=A0A1D8EXG6_9CAUD|nr:hypothetical protein FDH13_gp074 [Campylobacter phage vB_CjeM_Los1]AOT25895.1 hypothetical protein LOS1_00074 [Campylobacter phage vB_CjeM_Los1]